jgi:hypothetical protein
MKFVNKQIYVKIFKKSSSNSCVVSMCELILPILLNVFVCSVVLIKICELI